MHMKKLILGLLLVFSCNVLSAQKTKFQIAKDYVTENLKQVVASTTNNAYVKKTVEVYNKYPLAISAAVFSLYDMAFQKGKTAKISGIIANLVSTYGVPLVMQYFQEIGLMEKDVTFAQSPTDVLIRYHLLNKVVSDVVYKLVNSGSQSFIKIIANK